MTATDRPIHGLLRTGISVTSHDARLHAFVELHGELCAPTAPGLRRELDQLLDDGIADITVDLRDLRLCTSHGLDLFDDVNRALHERAGGALRLRLNGTAPVVIRTVQLVSDVDPTFSPQITEAPAASERMAPHERPGDSTS